ncbi:hypothetical protein H4P12_17840 [Paracoccus sp. 11-3]|uniref:Uncharacterized protein n=1 Tax=Paracoccus amoyensis TaxID=2760093 RepID=A0A926J7N9_9RHOB|nr:hypothetical protein [Paracoccus amoyensis]MBC9248527.1 hypothetical protein [Paracoccus amoyensis]
MLLTSGDGVIASMPLDGAEILTFDLSSHSHHGGQYRIDPALLSDGAVCLAAPRIAPYQDGDDSLRVQPGLWVCLDRIGWPVIHGQWLRDETLIAGRTGPDFPLDVLLSDASFTYVETMRQGGRSKISASAPVRLSAKAPVSGELRMVPMADATLQVALAGPEVVTVAVVRPADFAGQYQVDPTELALGPVVLVPPVIAWSEDETAFHVRRPGLWAYDPERGDLALEYQWLRDGNPVADAMQSDMAASSAAIATVNVVERAVQAHGQRDVISNDLLHDPHAPRLDSFATATDTALASYRGISAEVWTNLTTVGNITLRAATGQAEPAGGTVFIRGATLYGARQFAEADIRCGNAYANGSTLSGIGVAVCAQVQTGNPAIANRYALTWAGGVGKFRLTRHSNGAGVLIAEHGPVGSDWIAGAKARMRLEYDQGTLRAYVKGALIITVQDNSLADGGVGLLSDTTAASGRLSEALSFKGRIIMTRMGFNFPRGTPVEVDLAQGTKTHRARADQWGVAHRAVGAQGRRMNQFDQPVPGARPQFDGSHVLDLVDKPGAQTVRITAPDDLIWTGTNSRTGWHVRLRDLQGQPVMDEIVIRQTAINMRSTWVPAVGAILPAEMPRLAPFRSGIHGLAAPAVTPGVILAGALHLDLRGVVVGSYPLIEAKVSGQFTDVTVANLSPDLDARLSVTENGVMLILQPGHGQIMT